MSLRESAANWFSGGALARQEQRLTEQRQALGSVLQRLRETDMLLERTREDLGWSVLGQGMQASVRSLEAIRALSRQAFQQTDAFVKDACLLITYFCFSQGVDCPTSKIAPAQEALRGFWNESSNQQAMFGALAQYRRSLQLLLDGSLFVLVRLGGAAGKVAVRHMPVGYVQQIIPDPSDCTRVLYYKVAEPQYKWDAISGTLTPSGTPNIVYYPDLYNDDPQNDPLLEQVGAKRAKSAYLCMAAINQLDDTGFGIPEPATSLGWFQSVKAILEDQATISAASARLMNQLVIESEADGDTLQAGLETMGQDFIGKEFGAGGLNILSDNAKLVQNRAATGAGDAWQNGRALRMAGAIGMGLPMHFLGDPENASLATAKTMDRPTFERLQGYQTIWVDLYRRLCRFALKQRRQEGAIFDVPMPNIVGEDTAALAPSVNAAAAAGYISHKRAALWWMDTLNVDDQEQELAELEGELNQGATAAAGQDTALLDMAATQESSTW